MKIDKNYLYEMYNATSTDDGKGEVETYENWLERQLITRIKQLSKADASGSQVCPNCEKEHDSDEWNGYCSKICWWGFPVDYH